MVTVRQIVMSGEPQLPNFSSVKDPGTSMVKSMLLKEALEEAPRCRICLDDETSEENPLIHAPCLCKGGMGCVHLECLRQWLATRYSVTNRLSPPVEGALALSFKPPACDVCKTEFPAMFHPTGDLAEAPVALLKGLEPLKPPF